MPKTHSVEETSSKGLLHQIAQDFAKVSKKATPAVVYIESYPANSLQAKVSTVNPLQGNRKGPYENPFDYFNDEFFNRFFGFPSPQERQPLPKEAVKGTGFIVSADGYIVTNNHVVDGAGKVQVTLNGGKKYVASIIGVDPKTDLAVIKIDEEHLPFLEFGDSEAVEVGHWAIAVGNPFGLQATVTIGVISAKGRNQLHIADFEDFIQTDAAINPGNSGGPLLNIDGQVVGVNTAIVSGSGGYMGIGFAIPSSMACHVMKQLIEDGQVTRGFLGVTLQPIDSDLASFYQLKDVKGALVTDILKDSPADKGGLRQEDIIIECNGKEVETLSAFRNAISLMSPQSKIELKVLREGKIIELHITIMAIPEDGTSSPLRKLGLKAQPLTPDLAQQLGFGNKKGILIVHVEPGSQAADSGIKAGHLILAVNRKKVSTMEEFNIALSNATKEKRLLLMIGQPGDVVCFVALNID
nr:DegQ family serine endoprotease [Candidatus Clavichlamydia salmonicola]